MKHDEAFIAECRRFIVGKTWLKIQLMQGATLCCHHSRKKHFASIGDNAVTEIHSSEIGLATEMEDFHCAPFRDLKCLSSAGDMDCLKNEWRLM